MKSKFFLKTSENTTLLTLLERDDGRLFKAKGLFASNDSSGESESLIQNSARIKNR